MNAPIHNSKSTPTMKPIYICIRWGFCPDHAKMEITAFKDATVFDNGIFECEKDYKQYQHSPLRPFYMLLEIYDNEQGIAFCYYMLDDNMQVKQTRTRYLTYDEFLDTVVNGILEMTKEHIP